MTIHPTARLAACGLMIATAQAWAAVPRDGARIPTAGPSSPDRWAVRPVRGEGWNLPIEGSVVVRSASFRPWTDQP